MKIKRILVKITSRERPQQLNDCIEHIRTQTRFSEALDILVTLDTDDPTLERLGAFNSICGCRLDIGYSNNKIHAINRGVPFEGWDILVNVSDDQQCIMPNFDHYIRGLMPDDLDASIWSSDGLQNTINTLEIVGRTYYNRTGYIYNPSYKSFFCDNFSTLEAQLLGKQIKTTQQIFKHNHPEITKVKDRLYNHNQTFWRRDEAQWKLDKLQLLKKYGAL